MYGVQVPSIIGASIAALDVVLRHARGEDTEMWALTVALTGFAITFWYTWIYGNYKRTKSQFLELGNHFPTVPLETLEGAAITAGDFTGSPTLIVFFRANWCTLCMAQLKELRDRADRLAGASVQVKFVSNQPVQKSKELARRLNLPGGFEILYDRDLRAARALGIVDEGGTPAAMTGFPRDTVMATVVGLDEQSRVIYVDEPNHYRQRPHPDSYLSVFDGQTAPITNDWVLPACDIGEHKTITAEESESCENC
jgi:peroxiredoxin